MKKISILAFLCSVILMSCSSEPSLQKYFVENTESKDFIAVDISSNILRLDKSRITAEEEASLKTFEKMNILAFKADGKNQEQLKTENAKLQAILKDKKYQELMKVNSGKQGGAVYFVGNDDKIEEFVLYGNTSESGFAVVRILGDEMNPTSIMTMLSLLQKANLDLAQLKPLEAMIIK